jgi:hypothetical protein
VSIHYQRNNHRVYATAQQSFAIVLLKRLKSNPHAFLQALRSTTRQRRVGFTFYRVLPGETK